MSLLVLIITLSAYKLLGFRVNRSYDQWFIVLVTKLSALFQNNPRIVTLLALLIPVSMVSLLLWLFESLFFGLIGVLLHAVILFYSFGRDNLPASTEQYLQYWKDGDVQAAYRYAVDHFRVGEQFSADDLPSMQQEVRAGLLYQWFEQIFVVIFWYLVAGPLVALFIRLICIYDNWLRESQTGAQMALALLHAIEWLPVRLLGFTFTIAGNFVACFRCWTEAVLSLRMPTERVLNNAGMAALGVCSVEDEQNAASAVEQVVAIQWEAVVADYARQIELIQDLVIRSLMVWLILVSVIVIS